MLNVNANVSLSLQINTELVPRKKQEEGGGRN
jgi:hypothetical protein